MASGWSVQGRSTVSTWLLAIARFKAISALRRRRDEELDEEAAAAIEDLSDNPATALEKKDKSAMLRKCLAGLSAEHREVIDLVYYHEKSVHEVAEIVGIPENTVKTRMFYARKRLAELLKSEGVGKRLAMNAKNKEPEHQGIEALLPMARGRDAEPPRRQSRGASAGRRPRTGAAK